MRRLALAAAVVVAAAFAPSAHAQGGCWPHVYEQTLTVGDQTVTYYTVRMIC